jgi:asparagine synthase (glutamine-hydrolysing)
MFFSDIEDFIRLFGAAFEVDRYCLSQWLTFNSMYNDKTALNNVVRMPRGRCLTISQAMQGWSTIWNPAAIAAAGDDPAPEDAARRLGETVQKTVSSWASRYKSVAHCLSGGLDSSIVAGCLSMVTPKLELIYINIAIASEGESERFPIYGVADRMKANLQEMISNGDERYFARLVAQRWNVPLVERLRDPGIDLRRLGQVPLTVSPAVYFSVVELDDAQLEISDKYGIEAFFSGQAGDSLLFATVQPFPAIDYAYRKGVSRELWKHIEATSLLSKESLWSVVSKTIIHGVLRRPYVSPVRLMAIPTLVASEFSRHGQFSNMTDEGLLQQAEHYKLPPGKVDHVVGVVSDYSINVFHSGTNADHIDPLNSQLVWEVMLKIPTYTVLAGGLSRGLARKAFAGILPKEICRRQAKATGSSFYRRVVRNNRAYLLDRLADGMLVHDGYLDRKNVLECLTMDDPSLRVPAPSILGYLSAELWLDRIINLSPLDGQGSISPL